MALQRRLDEDGLRSDAPGQAEKESQQVQAPETGASSATGNGDVSTAGGAQEAPCSCPAHTWGTDLVKGDCGLRALVLVTILTGTGSGLGSVTDGKGLGTPLATRRLRSHSWYEGLDRLRPLPLPHPPHRPRPLTASPSWRNLPFELLGVSEVTGKVCGPPRVICQPPG